MLLDEILDMVHIADGVEDAVCRPDGGSHVDYALELEVAQLGFVYVVDAKEKLHDLFSAAEDEEIVQRKPRQLANLAAELFAD